MILIQIVQTHQGDIGAFVERIETEQSLRGLQCSRIIALFLQHAHQFLSGVVASLAQALAIGDDPIVIAARQQIALIG